MKKIKLSEPDLKTLLIEGKVVVDDIEIDATREFEFPKDIYELIMTKQEIDKNIEMFFDRNKVRRK